MSDESPNVDEFPDADDSSFPREEIIDAEIVDAEIIDAEIVDVEAIGPADAADRDAGLPTEQIYHALGHEKLRLSGYFSWCVVVVLTVTMVTLTAVSKISDGEPHQTSKSDLMQVNLQAQSLLAQKGMAKVVEPVEAIRTAGPQTTPTKSIEEKTPDEVPLPEEADDHDSSNDSLEAPVDVATVTILVPEALDDGTYEQRLCYAIILNELYGAEKALVYLDELKQKVIDAEFELSDSQENLKQSVSTLLTSYGNDDFTQQSVSADADAELREKLGFCGDLVLTPAQGPNAGGRANLIAVASQKAWGLFAVVLFSIALFLAGVISVCVILGLVLDRRSAIQFQNNFDATNVYIQTFALWMVIFFGGQFALAASGLLNSPAAAIFGNVGGFVFSLIALVWPVFQGRSLGRVFSDIGWTTEGFFKNVGVGFAAYAAWLPAVLVAFFFVFVITSVGAAGRDVGEFELPSSPSHPIEQLLSEGDALVWLGVVLAACVVAPIVEETMFRGILYRHLRELNAHRQRTVSVVIASVVNGLIFAAIHPQGIVAIPLLTMLAIGFSLTREWRNSLVSSIVMHGINNSLVTGFMFLVF